jgi:L-ascorbate metabolism protein UlaG (beta-lactamase superfamily)
MEELVEISRRFHVVVALLNLGAAVAPLPDGPLQITMDGKQGARLFRDIKADILVPMHYESWDHFTQKGEELAKAFEEEDVQDKVRWLTPGISQKIV